MTIARLFLSGIRSEGRHGARTGEKDDPQPFVVDLDLEVDVGNDDIGGSPGADTINGGSENGSGDTVDYFEFVQILPLLVPRTIKGEAVDVDQ